MIQPIIQDEGERQRALDASKSFIVQAPAGSGKTELLTQRFLVLLSHVNTPEEILAITFTKKASAEMRARIIKTLKKASTEHEPLAPHEKKTWQLAQNALRQDKTLGWNLLDNPNRLRVQTIDSLNASLIKHLPILSHFGSPPEITDNASPLYREAVQEFLSHLEENVAWSDAIAQLLGHMDNDLRKVQTLLINMLAKRDQWLPYIMIDTDQPTLRQELEYHLASVVTDTLSTLESCFPHSHSEELLALARYAGYNSKISEGKKSIIALADITTLPAFESSYRDTWLGISDLFFTQELSWRKSIDKKIGFPAPSNAENNEEKALFKNMKVRMDELIKKFSANDKLHHAFIALNYAPTDHYQEMQWETLNALYQVLRIVVAQLKVVFRNHGKIDYIENAQAALFALGSDEAPTDLALALDYQIRHILIDEFQDTSNSQYRLIEKLTAGWDSTDGRTLFVVGDPMQSIYRFREAEVGLFIRARKKGIGHIHLEPLTLSVNFRSTPIIVDWVNKNFKKVLPAFEDIATGAVSYSQSTANQAKETSSSIVTLHPTLKTENAAQANAIIELIKKHKQAKPADKIAILVRARTHLEYIIPALKKAHLPYRAIEIDKLNSRPAIQDLIALTRALLHPADRIAWLAILRSPWCGLSLNDLLIIGGEKTNQTIWSQLQKKEVISLLSVDGQTKLARIIPTLRIKLHDRQRYSLRLWIESTWILLGGPASLEQESDLEDTAEYFSLLQRLDKGGDLLNLDNLATDVSRLYAAPNNLADNTLQIMTIHNAKGLEFDTVILPHLERLSPNEEKQLLLWMEKPRDNAKNALILAPVHAIGEDNDSIYDYIKKQHAIKTDHEVGRLLYVATTRAKNELHLFFTPKTKDSNSNDLSTSKVKSLLEKLWPTIKNEIFIEKPIQAEEVTSSESIRSPRLIRRLTSTWENPIHENTAEIISYHQKRPGFKLSQDNPQFIGTLTHKILEQISLHGADWWQNTATTVRDNYIKNHLMQLGVLATHCTEATSLVNKAISNTLNDSRGQWILHPHHDAKSELALTAIIDGEMKTLVIDRTFVDEKGIRWIIDFKTALLGEQNIEAFLLAEQQEYAKKMHLYAQAMQILDVREIRLGLYFPAIPAWQEWENSNIPPIAKPERI